MYSTKIFKNKLLLISNSETIKIKYAMNVATRNGNIYFSNQKFLVEGYESLSKKLIATAIANPNQKTFSELIFFENFLIECVKKNQYKQSVDAMNRASFFQIGAQKKPKN